MTPPTEEELRLLAKRRVQNRNGFLIHLMMYVAVNAGLVVIWAIGGRGYPWFLWPLMGWGVGILAHIAALFIGPDSAGEARAIEREIRRLRTRTHAP
jgi:hypothetical protein